MILCFLIQSLIRAKAFHSQQDIIYPCHKRNTMRCVSPVGSWGHFGELGPLVHVFTVGASTEWPVTGTFTGPNQFPGPGKVVRSIPKKVWVGLWGFSFSLLPDTFVTLKLLAAQNSWHRLAVILRREDTTFPHYLPGTPAWETMHFQTHIKALRLGTCWPCEPGHGTWDSLKTAIQKLLQ